MEKVTEKVADILIPQERKEDDDALYGKDGAGLLKPMVSADDAPLKSPLAQGHLQPEGHGDESKAQVSAPAGLTTMTGQYVTDAASDGSEEELKKHGTAVGLASATMASGAVGQQNPSNVTV